jgi:nicotinic acid mononucleotide adenylyltransferase
VPAGGDGHRDWLEVSSIEVDRDGPSYTVDTLREIHARRSQVTS